MGFSTDKQTLDDLGIFGKPGKESIYAIFERTHTHGGALILKEMFKHPISDGEAITRRSGTIRYFKSIAMDFPFEHHLFEEVELYLDNTDKRTKLTPENHSLGRKFSNLIAKDLEYKTIGNGVMALIEILQGLRDFLHEIQKDPDHAPYHDEIEKLQELLAGEDFKMVWQHNKEHKLSYANLAEYDTLLRFRMYKTIREILYYVYQLDVYISVAKVALERGFVFPKALDKERHSAKLSGVYHPLLEKAVPNTLIIDPDKKVIFLTGANMAGKSTFMKSVGIAMFLAHMGFPVAASSMEFSVQDGIYTSINLPDNLSMGISHFYAEVLRVKKVASEIRLNKNLFVIFDELFRGTNVKDAYEATIAITAALAKRDNCMFIVSTHIIEAGEALKQGCKNIHYTYLPTRMDKNVPVYTYTLEEGITDDRHGMVIINNEGILEILKKNHNKAAS